MEKEKSGFKKGEPTDLIGKLELALGCMIGSHTHNYSPREQFEMIITDLRSEQKAQQEAKIVEGMKMDEKQANKGVCKDCYYAGSFTCEH